MYEWDVNKTHSYYTLSNSNRTVTANTAGTSQSAISDWSKAAGKWYWEIVINNRSSYAQSIGFCDQSGDTDFNKNVRSGWNESWALLSQPSSLRVYHDAGYSTLSSLTWDNGDIIMIALDIDAGKAWFGENGTWYGSGDPANGSNPTYNDNTIIGNVISACVSLRYVNDQMMACFRADQLTYSLPSGFSAPDTAWSTELVDTSLDLAAYYQHFDDLKSFLRAHDGVELYDFQSKLEAAGWNIEDFASFLSAYYENMDDDIGLNIITWGTHYDDQKIPLAAWLQRFENISAELEARYEGFSNGRAFLEAAAFMFKNFKTWMTAYGQSLASLPSPLWAGKAVFKNLDLYLSATDGLILCNLALFLSTTNGIVQKDLGVALQVIGSVPVFRSITAQRISSVVSEVAQ
ncbi:hypothetical protein PITCH_A140037 [uncultured Desulfobacterium sp.]|uniref:B30.2/SPRY domain-containing protein n=1 Tax=uncultured Desulfobacterium sp. TaxID=201089 RepID=A0A445MSV5_9BACT|nr:hypothetical protein PITCH_A140037 [uncultured Desulfobacterium sp.]